MKKISCRISAVVLLDTDEDSFFYDDSGKNNTVNILTGADTFKIWGLPDENYTRVGVRLKENIDTARFEQKWMEVLQQAGYMDSIDVFDIVREKQMTSRQIMAVFYAMICVLILLGCVCLGNSLAIRIRQMGRQQQILNMLGMTWWHLVKLYILRYARLGFFGACVSVIPPVIYSLFARKASRLQAQMAADDIVTDGTSASWIDSFPHYSMISGMLVQAVFIVGLLAVITLSLLVIFQSRYLKRVFQKEE
jgi:ABC-type lipoprotein release transport system permease subunit